MGWIVKFCLCVQEENHDVAEGMGEPPLGSEAVIEAEDKVVILLLPEHH